MANLWAARFEGTLDGAAGEFNSSIAVDGRMYKEDIEGSLAHAEMLAATGIISAADGESIRGGLRGILRDIESGALTVDPGAEDIHMFIEAELTRRIGDAGKRLHTARSRNDQVATDIRLYMRRAAGEVKRLLLSAVETLADKAGEYRDAICPGYTHLQRAQPVTFGHWCMAYAYMFRRDIGRVDDAARRMNLCPLGAAALAGTTYPTDRAMTARLLGFDAPTENSLDSVADRDFLVELTAAFSLIITHLSRICEELVLWSSAEFKFVEPDDAFSTGSSIMPQKKNPDMAELIRGKAGRVYGDLQALLTMLKGLPLAYNKDMQEDKAAVFDALDTVTGCLRVFIPMFRTLKVFPDSMRRAVSGGFINATDCADYLTRKGVPFREAYSVTGRIVAYCSGRGLTLETLPLGEYRSFSPAFEDDIYSAVSPEVCLAARRSYGGPTPESVDAQIAETREYLRKAGVGAETPEHLREAGGGAETPEHLREAGGGDE